MSSNVKPHERTVQPDVTIVVGGKEYHEYQQVLCFSSQYFDGAFRSGMKEAESKRFEFPDMDLKDWELFSSVISPCRNVRISSDNIEDVLRLFDQFCVTCSKLECDRVYCDKVFGQVVPFGQDYSITDISWLQHSQTKGLADALALSLEHQLPTTMSAILKLFKNIFPMKALVLNRDSIYRVLSIIKDSIECRDALWPSIFKILPSTLQKENPNVLLANGILPDMIVLYIETMKQCNGW